MFIGHNDLEHYIGLPIAFQHLNPESNNPIVEGTLISVDAICALIQLSKRYEQHSLIWNEGADKLFKIHTMNQISVVTK